MHLSNTNYKLLIAAFMVATIIITCSLFGNHDYSTHDKVETSSALQSQSFEHSVYISIGVLIPLMIDYIFGLSTLWTIDIVFRTETWIIPCLFILVQSCNIYLISRTISLNSFWVSHVINYCQVCIICNGIFALQLDSLIKQATPDFNIIHYEILFVGFFNIAMIMKVISVLYITEGSVIVWTLLLAGQLYCVMKLFCHWYEKHQTAVKTGLQNQYNIYCLAELLLLVGFILATEICDLVDYSNVLYHSSTTRLILYHTFILATVYLLSTVYAFKNKQLAKFSIDALETKRSFVRYVSHEIRTPLNAACLGLQLLDKELHKLFALSSLQQSQQQSPQTIPPNNNITTTTNNTHSNNTITPGDDSVLSIRSANSITSGSLVTSFSKTMIGTSSSQQNAQLVEIVADINQACNIAVEILNDLLMYEKIDGGLLVLEAQEVSLWPFVDEVLKLFSVQAKVLELELIWQPIIDLKVMVMIDRYKMSQVIRNLVSNALKFSSVGNKVFVTAEVIPASSNRTSSFLAIPNSPMSFQTKKQTPVARAANAFFASKRNSQYRIAPDGGGDGNNEIAQEEGKTHQTHSDIEQGGGHQSQSMLSIPHSLSSIGLWSRMMSSFTWGSPSVTTTTNHHHLHHNHRQPSHRKAHRTSMFTNSTTSHMFESSRQHDLIRITVQDCGPGISMENQKRLFNEIVQFDAAKLQEGKGSGIGLWVSNKIMKLHGGRIGVYSEGEGHGSKFYIDIPITQMQTVVMPISASSSNSSRNSNDHRSKLKKNALSRMFRSIRLYSASSNHLNILSSATINHDELASMAELPAIHPTSGNSTLGRRRRSSGSTLASANLQQLTALQLSPSQEESGEEGREDGSHSDLERHDHSIASFFTSSQQDISELSNTSSIIDNFHPKVVQDHHHHHLPTDTTNTDNTSFSNHKPFSEVPLGPPSESPHGTPVPKLGRLKKMVSFREDDDINSVHYFERDATQTQQQLSPLQSQEQPASPTTTTVLPNNNNVITATNKAVPSNNKPLPDNSKHRIKRALVIDDSAVNRRMLRKFCLSYFDQVDEAVHGKDAVHKIQQQLTSSSSSSTPSPKIDYYDVIFTDYFMPEMNGLEVIQWLRGSFQYKGLIIGLTGNTDSAMESAFLEAGANRVLIKPIQGHDLQVIVQSITSC